MGGLHNDVVLLHSLVLAEIAVATSHRAWLETFTDTMTAEGYLVTNFADGVGLVDTLCDPNPGLVVIDLGVGALGVSLCAQVRSRSAVPILALAAPNAHVDELVAGYEAGPDLVLPRDTSPRILLARVRALLRRFPPGARAKDEVLQCGPIHLDVQRREVRVGELPVSLSPQEADVLEALLRRPGRVVTRTEVATTLADRVRDDRVIDRTIRGLRAALELADDRRRINTVRGVGFAIEAEHATSGVA